MAPVHRRLSRSSASTFWGIKNLEVACKQAVKDFRNCFRSLAFELYWYYKAPECKAQEAFRKSHSGPIKRILCFQYHAWKRKTEKVQYRFFIWFPDQIIRSNNGFRSTVLWGHNMRVWILGAPLYVLARMLHRYGVDITSVNRWVGLNV